MFDVIFGVAVVAILAGAGYFALRKTGVLNKGPKTGGQIDPEPPTGPINDQ